jgi:diaminopropionate ammonia-lyase
MRGIARDLAAVHAVVTEPWSARPLKSHLFVQAGMGSLAAAMADGLRAIMASSARVVVEPDAAACVGAALAAERPVPVLGIRDTAAEMPSCGEASAPALAVLLRHGAAAVAVPRPAG